MSVMDIPLSPASRTVPDTGHPLSKRGMSQGLVCVRAEGQAEVGGGREQMSKA